MCYKNYFILTALFLPIITFAQLPHFDEQTQRPAPDYSLEANWSALPFRWDAADEVPRPEKWISDSLKDVDVFFIYPTLYMKGDYWNADVADKKLNRKLDSKPIRYQATVFNNSCRVFAPRYRQAIVDVFYHDNEDGKKALDFAYEDVKRAFEYYLKHYNNGRPIIIASHSQGTTHSRRLLKDYFDGKPLSKQLVAAYAIGYTITDSMYTDLKMCTSPTETGCFISWLSFKSGFEPKGTFSMKAQSLNPLTWTRDTAFVGREKNLGSIGIGFNHRHTHATSAIIHHNEFGGTYLWIKTRTPFIPLLKNMHIADYNLFWYDIRENVKVRIASFKAKK